MIALALAPTFPTYAACYLLHRHATDSDGLYVFTRCLSAGCGLVRTRELPEARESRLVVAGALEGLRKRRELARRAATDVLLRGGR